MINPAGEYTFAGLGLIGLQLSQAGAASTMACSPEKTVSPRSPA
jgi:hypothetical protein